MADEVVLQVAAAIYTQLLAPTLSMANEGAQQAAMREACGRALDLQAALSEVVEARARAAEAKKKAEAEEKAKAEAAAHPSPGIAPQPPHPERPGMRL